MKSERESLVERKKENKCGRKRKRDRRRERDIARKGPETYWDLAMSHLLRSR